MVRFNKTSKEIIMRNQLAPRSDENFKKDINTIRQWLLGRNFAMAAFVLEYTFKIHNRRRKDNSHEFSHQVHQALFARTLSAYFTYPEETFCAIWLHDTSEDFPISFEEIEKAVREKYNSMKIIYEREKLTKFNIDLMMNAVRALTKEYKGVKKPSESYFEVLANDEIASLAKGFDRMHNLLSMGKAFSFKKQKEYIEETEQYILPMIKKAQKEFPHQNNAYENIKLVLKTQVNIIEVMLTGEEPNKAVKNI